MMTALVAREPIFCVRPRGVGAVQQEGANVARRELTGRASREWEAGKGTTIAQNSRWLWMQLRSLAWRFH